jgi:glutathione synthase/RimK-type ligase-like ATP-grasp enzyme
MSKSEEYRALEKAGIAVPRWVVLKEGETPDLSGFADYVVRKPEYGGLGAEVVIVRKTRVRWKAITMTKTGTTSNPLIQEFIYTGPRPISYRVNTLFGKVLYSVRHEASADRPELPGIHDFHRQPGLSIVASARGSQAQLCHDRDIIQLGESAHAAFPEIPLLGFDVVREVSSGKLYVLEANAIGYIWSFTSHQVANYGFSFEAQFDGVRKAAYILAEKTQECAC